jgi:hypothetical protein
VNPCPKVKKFRSEKYKKFIRQKDCFFCDKPGPSDAHHESLDGGTMGGKPGDDTCLPLCRICHRKRHDKWPDEFWGDINWQYERKRLNKEYENKTGVKING